jgi:hypothetical protein
MFFMAVQNEGRKMKFVYIGQPFAPYPPMFHLSFALYTMNIVLHLFHLGGGCTLTGKTRHKIVHPCYL